jgi:hypothetical protein
MSRWNMDDPRVVELVATIERTILEHGFYILKNPLLSLVCGVDSALGLDDPWTAEFVQAFATKHDWSATLRNGAFCFYPRAGSIQNAVSPVGACTPADFGLSFLLAKGGRSSDLVL